MKTFTSSRVDISLLIVRVIPGIIVAAHGSQKLLGWFGGYGFEGTMTFFTDTIGLPYLIAFFIILAESVGMIALIAGLFSRLISGSLIAIMIGAIVTVHGEFGFFMNWSGNNAGEGFEFHLLIISLAMVIVINGPGAYSMDYILRRRLRKDALKETSLI
jgi:putative oxidoreductase